MKVLHVEAGRHLYGGALQVVFLLRGLQARGVSCSLACPQGSAVERPASAYAHVTTMPMVGELDIGMLVRLRRLIRSERPDIVHLHSRRGSDIWGALAARLEGIPVVLSRRVDNPEWRLLAQIKYRLHDRVVTISDGIRRVLLSEGVPAHKIRCVLDAVDMEQYTPNPNRDQRRWLCEEFNLAPDALVIGMVAQFIERKGHRTLLDALPDIISTHPQTQVLLFGQGPLLAGMRERVRASVLLSGHVQFPGFRNDLDRILPNLDVLAHPAFMEGLGVSLLQAAACGLPIVAGRAGGIPEVIQPGLNGALIAPGDSAALAHEVNLLLGDPALRERYGRAGRERVEKLFSIDAMVSGNLSVYKELISAP